MSIAHTKTNRRLPLNHCIRGVHVCVTKRNRDAYDKIYHTRLNKKHHTIQSHSKTCMVLMKVNTSYISHTQHSSQRFLKSYLSPCHSQTQGCTPEALNISLPLKLSSLSSLSFNHISPPLSSIATKGHTKHKGCLRFKLCTNLSLFVLTSPPLSS